MILYITYIAIAIVSISNTVLLCKNFLIIIRTYISYDELLPNLLELLLAIDRNVVKDLK